MAGGWALPLCGGEAAFTACEIWQRRPQGLDREVLPATELDPWLNRQPDEVRAAATQLCTRLGASPSWPDGLPSRRPLLMGVVNVTPDSFSDGGAFFEPAAAVEHGLRLHAEGADILMVKPAGAYLDILCRLRQETTLPLAAYQVSGEFAMIKHAAAAGAVKEEAAALESLLAIRRAGADLIFSYFAPKVAEWVG